MNMRVVSCNTQYNNKWFSNVSANTRMFGFEQCMLDASSVEKTFEAYSTPSKKQGCQEIFEKLSLASRGIQERIQKKSAVEQISPENEIPRGDIKAIGLTSYEISSMASQLVMAGLVKDSDLNDPIVQIAYGKGDERKVYHVHVNDVDTSNASDMEMFALLSYEGYKGNNVPGAINNYSAYKAMKANAGYGMGMMNENSFVNDKINAEQLLQEVYDLMKDGQSPDEKKNADICDYLLQMLKNRSDLSGERKWS